MTVSVRSIPPELLAEDPRSEIAKSAAWFFAGLSARQRELLRAHLLRRAVTPDRRAGLGVVFDLLQECNLACTGCCTSARRVPGAEALSGKQLAMSTDDVLKVLDKIRAYYDGQEDKHSLFINYGGGEPFLRHDILPLLEATASRFGSESVGVDTNGTRCPSGQVDEIIANVGYLGISLDGLRSSHNEWRGAGNREDAFTTATDFIKRVVRAAGGADKLEVSTVPTKRNLDQIPLLMRYLADIGVKRYSVHRTMLVGRYWHNRHLDAILPEASDYLNLLVAMLEENETLGLDIHIHHSLESIYTTLLLGFPTYFSRDVGDPDRRSSFGVDWRGRVFFDPWSMGEPLRELGSKSLLDDGVDISKVIQDCEHSILAAVTARRCKGCQLACSGGSRIGAALHKLARDAATRRRRDIPQSLVLSAFDEVDPLCPLHTEARSIKFDDARLLAASPAAVLR